MTHASVIRLALFSALLCLTGCPTTGPQGPDGPQGPQGPAGPPGGSGVPSISGITPSQVVAGYTYQATISGFATEWADTAQVSFGPGISVTSVKAASPTSLVVTLVVAPEATSGDRDVTVTQGTTAAFWRAAFMVVDRYTFTWLGKASEVSMSVVRVVVNEPGFDFDTSTASSGGLLTYPGIAVAASPEFPLQILSASRKQVDMVVLADLDAGQGAYDVNVVSHPGSFSERLFSASQVFTVTGNETKPILEGNPITAAVASPYASASYKYTTGPGPDGGTPTDVVMTVTSPNLKVHPRIFLLRGTGSFNDLMGFGATAMLSPLSNEAYYLVVWDSDGAASYPYTVSVSGITKASEEEPNDLPAQARSVSAPGIEVAQLSSGTDVDYFKVSATAADVGKRFHVVTRPGDLSTDTVLEVFRADGTTSLGGSSDDSKHEDHFSSAIPAAGEYLVKVTASPASTWNVANSHYELLVTIE